MALSTRTARLAITYYKLTYSLRTRQCVADQQTAYQLKQYALLPSQVLRFALFRSR